MVSNNRSAGLVWALALLLAFVPRATAEEDGGEVPSKPTGTNGCTELGFEGKASFGEIGSLGQFNFDFNLVVANRTDGPIEIRTANLLLGHEGGWLIPLDPESLDGSYFRGAMSIPAGAHKTVGSQEYKADTPATHAVLIAQAEDGHCAEAIPIGSESYQPPPAVEPPYPFGIGVIAPLHVIPFADGEDSVLFIGQHQVLNGVVPTDVETELSVSSDKGGSQPVKWKGFDAEGDLVALWPFVRRLPVFKGFESGLVRIAVKFQIDGKEHALEPKTWAVKRIQPALLRAPVTGTWQLSNGPGSARFHDHYANPHFRYAYDLVQVDAKGRTHDGNPHENKSYFAWNKSVLAAADGEIVAFCDDKNDNPGYSRGKQCALNYIIVKHANEIFTAYLHLKHRSRPQGLLVGTRVRAGQHLARVGNSGESSEPHLHFMAFTIDQTGRIRSIPVAFGNGFHDSLGKRPVEGVPLGGRVYHFRGR